MEEYNYTPRRNGQDSWEEYGGKGGDIHSNFRRDHGSDGWEESRYRHKSRKVRKRKKKPGCWANEGKSHVYVWTTEFNNQRDLFLRFYGYHKFESRVCAGCHKIAARRTTERYNKKRTHRWGYWEMNDERFRKYRNDWEIRTGQKYYGIYGW